MIVNRVWAMPNSKTFSIRTIGELVSRYTPGGVSASNRRPICQWLQDRNDNKRFEPKV